MNLKKLYMVWLAVGVAVFAHGAITGGGVEGAIVCWQIEHTGRIQLGTTEVLLAVALILPPLLLLLLNSRFRSRPFDDALRRSFAKGGLIVCAGFLTLGVLAMVAAHFTPDPHAAPARVVLDQVAPDAVTEHTTILVGTPRTAYAVSYQSLHKIGRTEHSFVPMTVSNWMPDQPVHFLLDTSLLEFAGGGVRVTRKGLLLRHHIPGYLRDALRHKGIRLADDAMVHSTSMYAATGTWYGLAGVSALGGIFGLMVALGLRYGRNM